GGADEVVGAFDRGVELGDADGDRDENGALLERDDFAGDGLAHGFGEHGRTADVDFREDDGELFTAVARDDVGRAGALADEVGDLTQDVVAGTMTEGVVAALEVIDVEHHQRQGAAIATRTVDLAIEGLDEVALVEDLRQAIDGGEAIDLL